MAMKFNTFNYSKFRNAECISLSNDVIQITKTYDWEKANVINLFTWLQDSNAELKNQVNKLGTVNETHEVKQADDRFNDAWRAIKLITKAFLLSPVKTERESAAVVRELINSHGAYLYKESYHIQNVTAKLFLNDCIRKPEVKLALETLRFQNFVGNIELAHTALLNAISHRKDKKVSELNDKETRVIRNRLNANLNRIFRYMEVMSDVAPGGPLETMIKEINESILKIETAIKIRTHKFQEVEETEIK